jgi:hypothetical protein
MKVTSYLWLHSKHSKFHMAVQPHHRCVPHIHVGSSRTGISNTSMDSMEQRRSWGSNQQHMEIFLYQQQMAIEIVSFPMKNGDSP